MKYNAFSPEQIWLLCRPLPSAPVGKTILPVKYATRIRIKLEKYRRYVNGRVRRKAAGLEEAENPGLAAGAPLAKGSSSESKVSIGMGVAEDDRKGGMDFGKLDEKDIKLLTAEDIDREKKRVERVWEEILKLWVSGVEREKRSLLRVRRIMAR